MEIPEIEVESRVSAVTVFQGRAMITRHAEVFLEAGNQRLIFTDLPENLNRNSIQVKGTGEVTLGESSFETEYFLQDVNTDKQLLLDKQQELRDSIEELTLEIEVCEREKSFIERIAGYITTPTAVNPEKGGKNASTVNVELNASTWGRMLDFYHEKSSDINRVKLTSERKIRELEKELEKLGKEINEFSGRIEKKRNIIKVSLTKKTSGSLALDLSYLLSGPSWRPFYSLRASSDKDTVMLEYNALINQATGEDWRDVDLKLSTARVSIPGTIPKITPWHLNIHRSGSDKMAAGAEEEVFQEISMSTAAASVVYTVAGGGNINGDNSDTRVSLMKGELPAEFQYTSVPKLTDSAFLTAKIINESEFIFLPGKINIFLDGSYVSNTSLSFVMPNQEMEVPLGVAEGVNVEYRFIKRFKKNEGIVGKRVSEQFEYRIKVNNNRGMDIQITVYDQFPISGEKAITVKPLSPLVNDNPEEFSLDDEQKITWKLKLAPGEIRELPVSFLVEYPAGAEIPGL